MTVDSRARRVRWCARRGRRWASVFAALTFALSGGYLQAPAVVTTPPPAHSAVAQVAVTSGDEAVAQERVVVEPGRPVVVAVAAPLWTETPAVPPGVLPGTAGSRAPPAV